MKEKENVKYLYYESWEKAFKMVVLQLDGFRVLSVYKDQPTVVYGYEFLEPMELTNHYVSFTVKRWMVKHPMPRLNHDGFLSSLVNRVETLEAALAEKGGQK